MSESLQPLGLSVERPNDLAHTLASGLESAQRCLDFLGQLRCLFEPRVEDINLSTRLFIGGVATVGETNRHGSCTGK